MDPTLPQRHHRRSMDRVWPPALEVRLARLSIDEGSSLMNPHMIIPVPPPVGYEGSGVRLGLPDIPDDEDPCEEEKGAIPGTVEPSTEPPRRGSLAMASPTILELDAAHQQQHHEHRRQSQVNIKFSNHGSGRSNSLYISNTHRGRPHITHQQSLQEQTAKLPMYLASSMMMDTDEFGEDLFHTDTTAPFQFERLTSFAIPEQQPGVYYKDSADSHFNIDPLPPTLPLASSPCHRHGGPLSAPSSKATSRANSPLPVGRTPLQEKSLSITNLQQPVANRPASPGLLHFLQPLDPQSSKPTVLDSLHMSIHDDETTTTARPRSPVPAVMDMMALMEDEQDRWKSPTLSALASRSSSLASSPGGRSPSRVVSPSTLVARLRRQRRQLQRPRRGIHDTGGLDPELLEIPLIEARDEVSLQEIWRMEDEERQDRILNDDDDGGGGDENKDPYKGQENMIEVVSSDGTGAGHLRKGEQHAHEEARLIQQAIDHTQ
ncbi:hypothetical protein BGZ74_005454 [Mortierella antarctica]|nr:hypothetical protein BGZ74_005454 [Mortierella antarctica]